MRGPLDLQVLLAWEGGTCAIEGGTWSAVSMFTNVAADPPLQNHESASIEESRHGLASIGKHNKEKRITQQLRRPESGVASLKSVKR